MTLLSERDHERVEQAIKEAETKSTGEFVTAIAEASDDYLYIPTLVAAGIVFLVSGLVLLLPIAIRVDLFYAGQVAGFIALALVFRWPPLRMALVPRAVREERARRYAHQLFLDLGLSSTRDRTGVLLFVSEAEHYVEIIADRGVQQDVDNAVWERIVQDLTADVRAGRTADGFVKAVAACTAVMAERHPWHEGDTNELPNRLIEV